MEYKYRQFMLKTLEEKDLDLVRSWRNSFHVRKWMFNQAYISIEQQLGWFKNRKGREDFMFSKENARIGLTSVFSVKDNACEFGFYVGEERLLSAGYGVVMEFMLLEMLFSLGYGWVRCITFKKNQPVISQHERFGFKECKVFRDINGIPDTDVMAQEISPDVWAVKRKKIRTVINRMMF